MKQLRSILLSLTVLLVMLPIATQARPSLTDSIAESHTERRGISQHKAASSNDSSKKETISITLDKQHLISVLSDSLHRAAKAELGIPAEDSENSDTTKAAKAPTRREQRAQKLATFTPDPSKATWAGIVFPGGGQIYNHKYWKLPIVYGGFLGCAYALNWNNQMYSDYSQAYLDIMDDDPGTASYEDFLPPRYNIEANKDYLKRVFKNRKDNYRRQRDLSIFCFIGVYLISVIDAYVDAELSNFDISEDLSVQVRPSIIDHQRHATPRNTQSYGLQCSFSF